MRQALKSFGRRYLSQLRVLPVRSLLLSLGEEGVNAHRLPHFKLTAQAARTRYPARFVSSGLSRFDAMWSAEVEPQRTASPSQHPVCQQH